MSKIVGLIINNRILLSNFIWVSILQIFLLIAPLVTYPYLVKVLGLELYGLIITAQVLVSYASIIIDFGSNKVCAKHVSINREDKDKLSEIISSVLLVRFILWIFCFIIYFFIVFLHSEYHKALSLFLLTYGLTLNDVLFPQFFFQGIEKMKYSTIVNITIKIVFIILIFVFVRQSSDFLWVPILYTLGYTLGGLYSLYIIFSKMGIHFVLPPKKQVLEYVIDSRSLLATELVCTIKDKLNYLLLGSFSGMGNVAVYDLGMKIYGLLSKPAGIISIVLFPKLSKYKSVKLFNKVLYSIVIVDLILIFFANLFLPNIVDFFINDTIDLWPIRLFTFAPLFSTTSAFIMNNMCIAFGYNKYALYSILFTTVGYIIMLIIFLFMHYMDNIYAFVLLALISYFIEFLYRIYAYKKVISQEKNKIYEYNN